MADLGVGVIGLGRMGSLHAEHLQGAIRGARLVAAVVDSDHRSRFQASGSAPCPLVADVAALVRDPHVDVVVIASPSNAHQEHTTEVALAGKPIFCEKPLADSVDGARSAIADITRAGIPFQIGFQRRFDPGYARAKTLIEQGAIGEVEMFRGLTCDRIPPIDYLRTSGGLFRDLGVHDFDAARFLMGDEVVAVQATGAILVEPALSEFDDIDHGIVTLRCARGGLGVVQNAWRAPAGYDIRAEVHGTAGKVVTELDEDLDTRLYDRRGRVVTRHFEFMERFRPAYRLELQAFIDAVQGDKPVTPTANDGLQALLIADAATRSRREGTWVTIDD
ncbi:MAG: inositol 2-dehydrogenase [Chloroflexota bacterium]|nr:inositol 2-dehydrogenase [Chloroflexota bacterium]